MPTPSSTHPPRILILGAGFAGLYLTQHLLRELRHAQITADVTLVDARNFFLFSPLLHEVTAGMVEVHHVIHPIRQFLRKQPVKFHEWRVQAIDLDARTVQTDHGPLAYDYLVVALGCETNFFGIPGVAQYGFPMKSLRDAVRLRNHILTMFETASAEPDSDVRQRLLTFVVAGAGFTGIETITEVHDLIFDNLLADYPTIKPDDIRLLLVDALPDIPCTRTPHLAGHVRSVLAQKGITLRLCTRLTGAGPGWIEFAGAERIPTHTLIWTAGITAPAVVASLPVEKDRMGRIHVLPSLQVPGYEHVFTLGDCAHFRSADGSPLPTTAQVANQQAPVGAANLVNLLTGRPLKPFRFRALGELASLGTRNAIADLCGVHFTGFFAWWIWRTIYLAKMPWWVDRIHIAIDWTLDLLFTRDTSRVDLGPCPTCTLHPPVPAASDCDDDRTLLCAK
jgi:NADH dehydrogenase